jgi:hypothetical protein
MTHLRALIGACFLLAVMGCVVAFPLGWTIILGICKVFPEKLTAASLIFRRQSKRFGERFDGVRYEGISPAQ